MNYYQAADTLTTSLDADTLGSLTFDISRAVEEQNIILPVIGYVVVFAALLFLFIIFRSVTKIIQHYVRRKTEAKKEEVFSEDRLSISGELNAAIGMALYLHFNEAHDNESTVLTIKKVQKAYSPWSSKIYGLREYPRN